MRFIIMAGASPEAPADQPPVVDDALFTAYMKFNEEMAQAGVLIASEGVHPTGGPLKVVRKGNKRTVVDGPYAEAKELVGGFYLIRVKSREEAIEWALRCPVGFGNDDVLEIRQLTDEEDLPPEIVEKVRAIAPTWSKSWR